MAVVVDEKPNSPKYSVGRNGRKSLSKDYWVKGTRDPLEAEANLPFARGDEWASDTDLYVANIDIRGTNAQGEFAMEATVAFEDSRFKSSTGDDDVEDVAEYDEESFSTSAKTAHIIKAIKQTKYNSSTGSLYTSDSANAEHGLLIGVDQDGRPQGVDVYTPTFGFEVTRRFLDEDVTRSYMGTLYGLTAKVNNDAFKGFDAGECLFLGVNGRRISAEKWEITYSFVGSPNASVDVRVARQGNASVSFTVTKNGHEYLWYEYADFGDVDGFQSKMTHANVAQVYEEGDFASLNIGV